MLGFPLDDINNFDNIDFELIAQNVWRRMYVCMFNWL